MSDDLAGWAAPLVAADLLGPSSQQALQALQQRLQHAHAVVALCGPAGAGKTRLANALLCSEGGAALLPEGPTCCPVELAWDPARPAGLSLLPIATRRQPGLVGEWRRQPARWHGMALAPGGDAPTLLAEALKTRPVSRRQAAALGLLPAGGAGGQERVDVPAWRHAWANLPHPLLAQGLCLLDLPTLQSMATEPELVLEQLPAADVLLWLLPAPGPEAAGPEAAACPAHPRTLRVACGSAGHQGPTGEGGEFQVDTALAVSAGGHDAGALQASGVPALAAACGDLLLGWRHRQQAGEVVSSVLSLLEDAQRRLREQRRSHAQQLLELRGLRHESGDRLAQLQLQVEQEADSLDRLAAVLDGLLLAQDRALRQSLEALDPSHLQAAAERLKQLLAGGLLRAPARAAAFEALCSQLRQQAQAAARHAAEGARAWARARERLQDEFGLPAADLPIPDLGGLAAEVDLIERGYSRYFTLAHAVRLATAAAAEPLRRMLLAKFKLLFAGARQALQAWQAALNPSVREPLAQRRAQLDKRAQALARIEQAADDLDRHLAELQARDEALLATLDQARLRAARLRQRAEQGPLAPTSNP